MKIETFQTPDYCETVAIIYDDDGSVALGISRAGYIDRKRKKITKEGGIKVAIGRAYKARTYKKCLCKKNYLRAFYGSRVD